MFSAGLAGLEKNNLLREIADRESSAGTRIVAGGKEYINFSSNDYLGLSKNRHLASAAEKALRRSGSGAGASRLLGGGEDSLHKKLERHIAGFKRTESALVLNSGYSANVGIIPAIAREGWTVLSDELNHASIVDGCRLSRAKTLVYRHKDMLLLEELLRRDRSAGRIVVTESIFSMDGDIAPLEAIFRLCRKYKALLYIDDAHGTGVLGSGEGALAHYDLIPEPWIIQMGTFSKALGSYGAFVTGSRTVIDWIINTTRSFIFSTALPPPVIAASIAALRIVERDSTLIKKLWENRDRVLKGVKGLGYDVMGSETPIIPLRTGDIKSTLALSGHLLRKGIYAPAIRPPAVKEPRIRITVTALHTVKDIRLLLAALR